VEKKKLAGNATLEGVRIRKEAGKINEQCKWGDS